MNRLSARSWRLLAAIGFWVLLAAAFITGGLAGLLLGYSAAIWLAIFSLGAWRRQDEFERAAQKFAWVFGGLFGLLASLALLPFILQPGILDPLLALIDRALGGCAIGIADGLCQGYRRDLPTHAPFILAPAAGAFLATIVDDGVPVAVCFFLI